MANLTDDLKRVPLFGDLSQRQLRAPCTRLQGTVLPSRRDDRPGGQMSGVDFFVILDGEATVDGSRQGGRPPRRRIVLRRARTDRRTGAPLDRHRPGRKCAALTMASWHFRKFVQAEPRRCVEAPPATGHLLQRRDQPKETEPVREGQPRPDFELNERRRRNGSARRSSPEAGRPLVLPPRTTRASVKTHLEGDLSPRRASPRSAAKARRPDRSTWADGPESHLRT
jgi:hypothetical protein